jgi:hypothetical protein
MPKIITRKEAIAKGLRRYFTGKPCKRGHVFERSIKGNCLVCSKISMKKYNQSDQGKDNLRKSQKKYNQSNKGKAVRAIAMSKYFKSEKGKLASKKAVQKTGGKYQRAWTKSEKGSVLFKLSQTKYLKSEKGKAVRKKANSKFMKSDKFKDWFKEKIKKDPVFKMKLRQRQRISELLGRKNIQKAYKTLKLLDCTAKFFKEHIEKQFTSGMSWENYGRKGWHVDHIIPLHSFNLKDPKEQLKAFHYSNCQPLWAEDNMAKRGKLNWKKGNKVV